LEVNAQNATDAWRADSITSLVDWTILAWLLHSNGLQGLVLLLTYGEEIHIQPFWLFGFSWILNRTNNENGKKSSGKMSQAINGFYRTYRTWTKNWWQFLFDLQEK
jgi:hypothetical protein